MKKLLLTSLLLCMFIQLTGQEKFTDITCKNTIRCIVCDDDTLWIGTDQGIVKKLIDGTILKIIERKDGLQQKDVSFICIDEDRNLWLDSYDGIVKYDGTNWEYFKTEDGLLDSDVTCMNIDKSGNIWVGTNIGISMYDGNLWTHHTEENGSLPSYSNEIKSIKIDSNNNIWAIAGNNLIRYNGIYWKWFSYSNGVLATPVDIEFDQDNNLWIIYKSYGDGAVTKIDFVNGTRKHHYPNIDGSTSDISIDGNNKKWVSIKNGTSNLAVFNDTTWNVIDDSTSNIDYMQYFQMMVIDDYDNKWLGTWDGLFKFDDSLYESHYIEGEIPSDNIASSMVDKNNNKWFGTSRGLISFDDNTWSTYDFAKRVVTGIKEDKENNIWFSSHGINKYDGENCYLYTVDSGLAWNYAHVIQEEIDGTLWFGHKYKSLTKYDGENWLIVNPEPNGLSSESIEDIAIDLNGNILFATYGGGISIFDGSEWSYINTENGLFSNNCYSIAVDEKNNYWIGNSGGLYYYNHLNLIPFNSNNTPYNSIGVKDIEIDLVGNVYFGSYNSFTKFDGVEWKRYHEEDGLVDNYIEDISIDYSGIKWIATNNGISKFEDGGAPPLEFNKLIKGYVFNDLNENQIKDDAEPLLSGQMIKLNPQNRYSVSNSNGFFMFGLPSQGEYSLEFCNSKYWTITTDSIINISIDSSYYIDTVYFGVKQSENISDAEANITGTTTRMGFDTKYFIEYKNIGTIVQEGNIEMNFDSRLEYLSSIPDVTSIDNDTLKWNFSNLAANENRQIQVNFKVPGEEYFGDTLCSSIKLHTNIEDNDLSNNYDTIEQIITGSFDPNDKLVDPNGIGDNGYTIHGTKLEYTIRFQNTGTDTAFNIVIKDPIDENLDLSTLNFTNSSHPYSYEIIGDRILAINFDNILLPDSNVNQLESNGLVKFEIYPNENLEDFTEINNNAYIYFDYNSPIETNTVKNTFVSKIPEIRPPQFVLETPSVDSVSFNSCNVKVALDEPGYIYYEVLKSTSPTPLITEVLAQDTAFISIDSSYFDIHITNLDPVTNYTLYLIASDTINNLQDSLIAINFETFWLPDTVPPTVITNDTILFLDGLGLLNIETSCLDNGSFDNIGIDTMFLSKNSFSCMDIGENSIWVYALDSSNNIDSAVSLVTILPSEYFEEYYSICMGDVLSWRGLTLDSPGIYYSTENNNCDSIFKLNLEVSDTSLIISYEEICGNYYFEWRGGVYNSSGVYYDSLESVNGCDSIFKLQLIVNPAYNSTETKEVCSGGGYTFPDGTILENITSQVVHVSNLLTALGCDSIIETTINVNPIYNLTETAVICSGGNYTFPDGTIQENITSQVIHVSNLQTVLGCDSIIETTVNVNPVITISETAEVCSGDSYIFPDGTIIENITSQIIYASNLQTALGCDSIIETTINVSPIYNLTETATVCRGESYTFPDGSTIENITSQTIHTSNLQTILGCDSVIETTVLVVPSYLNNETVEICSGDSYTFPNGVTIENITTQLVYVNNLQTVLGCDSTIEVTVNVLEVNTEVVQEGYTLTAQTEDAIYQWLNCDNSFQPINGETGQSFTATENGNFAVMVTQFDCNDTSDCYEITGIGILNPIIENGFKIYPNPTSGKITIEKENNTEKYTVRILNNNGMKVQESVFRNNRMQIDLTDYTPGIYTIQLIGKEKVMEEKLIIQ